MIPKTIHYCWFGRNPLPKLAQKCIKSWKKYCTDYQIVEWNEDNFDISACPLYVRQAYDAKKWAFVTDYVRLKIIYENGGIYLDTDVEIIKPLDSLLNHEAYFGFEDDVHINTGLGFGAIKHHPLIKELMDDYNNDVFILEDGSFNYTTCPVKNTKIFLKYGLNQDNSCQIINSAHIFSSEYFSPRIHFDKTIEFTTFTLSIHHGAASWYPKHKLRRLRRVQRRLTYKYKFINFIHILTHLPNIIIRYILGDELYNKIKRKYKR